MTTSPKMSARSLARNERAELGAARAREAIFDAVFELWAKRNDDGLKQTDIASALGKHPSWVCRSLAGPGNWTLETFGSLAEALDAQIDVKLVPREMLRPGNYDFYSDKIDGVPQTLCPVTSVRPDYLAVSTNVGPNAVLTVGTRAPQAIGGIQKTAKALADA